LDPRFTDSNPAEGDGFLMAIQVRNMTSFRGEVKPSVPCDNILRHVKDSYSMKRNTCSKIQILLFLESRLKSYSFIGKNYLKLM
jgi:hypothetical protein